MHLPSLHIHQNLTYEPQAEQELCVYQDTHVPPGITFAIVHISHGHSCTEYSLHTQTHYHICMYCAGEFKEANDEVKYLEVCASVIGKKVQLVRERLLMNNTNYVDALDDVE